MKNYSNGKKGFFIILHIMFIIDMIVGIFGLQFHLHTDHFAGECLFTIITLIGLFGSFITLAIITNMAGREAENDKRIKMFGIDNVPTDILLLLLIILCWGFVGILKKIHSLSFDVAGSLITVGTMAFLIDNTFLFFYLSFVRRIKMGQFFKNSIIVKVIRVFIRKDQTKLPLFLCTQHARERQEIKAAIDAIANGAIDTQLDLEQFHGQQREIAEAVNHISEGLKQAVSENTKNERMKADLITNVSHDIKTPLTSIVNYVDLLKRTNIEDERAKNYIRIIDEKANRLKVLTEDLVEASKISSGNIKLDMQTIDFVELLYQTGGEFNERFEARNLTIVTKLPNTSIMIQADGRQLYRVVENLYTNAAKYALEKTRVYVELVSDKDYVIFTMKNVAQNPEKLKQYLDLTERFVRGEESRTTEGSGLGLSIAKNLTALMGGEFLVKVDEDLFIATISFKMA